jgi:hypothetical protein
MVGRPLIATLALAAAVAPVSLLSAFTFEGRPASTSSVASASSREVRQEPEIVLKWVIRSADVVSCETAAPELRRLKHAYRGRLRVVVYGVAADTLLMRSFLRDELLGGAKLHPLTEGEFQQQFARQRARTVATPLIVLSDASGRDQVFNADVRLAAGRREVEAIGLALNAILRPARVLASYPPE